MKHQSAKFHAMAVRGHQPGQCGLRWRAAAAVAVAIFLFAGTLSAQNYAGTQHPFIQGAGARALGMGSAMVAYPVDATTVYWNAAGLDVLPKKNLTLFHTNIPTAGVSFNYVGYAHPFLGVGTFGLGVLHLGTDFIEYDDIGAKRGDASWNDYQIMLGFARQMPLSLTVGATLKLHRQSIGTSELDEPAQGFGADLGLLYTPAVDNPMLRGLALGFAVQNLIEPPLRPGTENDPIPKVLRLGLAKPFAVGNTDVLNVFFSYQSSKDYPARPQFGTEYTYQNRAMLRAGFNGGAPNFGAGVVYEMFQLDYSTGKYSTDAADNIGFSHRLSLTLQFGKSKEEMIDERLQKENERIEAQLRKQRQLEKQTEFAELMHDGKELFDQKEYFQAYDKFSRAKDLMVSDPEAKIWADKASHLVEEQNRKRQEEIERAAATAERKRVDSLFVENQFRKGMQYFDAGQYQEAIAQWQVGLERDPNDARLQGWIAKTQEEQSRRVTDWKEKGRAFENQGRQAEAIQAYNRLLSEGMLNAQERSEISAHIDALQTQLNVKDLFNQGVSAYLNRDYTLAVQYLKRVTSIDSKNKVAQKYLWDAESRLGARDEEFASDEIRRKFIQAVRLDQSGKYKEALEVLEEIQQQQRYNKRILDLIDQLREKIK